jgi:hypothetical protein
VEATSSRGVHLTRRALLIVAAGGAVFSASAVLATPPPTIQVWKDPNCGCCKDWVALLKKAGFTVHIFDQANAEVRARLGTPQQFGACHTGLVQGYVIEGHVPVSDILRLLKQKPKALGLAVPGMPVGSPGMDGAAYGGRRDPYKVLLVQNDGAAQVFNSYP